MAKIVLVGDVHGKIPEYQEILAQHDGPVIQLGDMGCGFLPIPKFAYQHRFIRGNHDDPAVAQRHQNYLGEFGYVKTFGIFFMGGAFSIDFQMRQEWMAQGISPCWWRDEELLKLTSGILKPISDKEVDGYFQKILGNPFLFLGF